jgi:diguanylate cyclase (GGDEF)-like protein
MLKSRVAFLAAFLLLIAQATVVWILHGQTLGARVSEILQLLLGITCIGMFIPAYRRAGVTGRYYWKTVFVTSAIWAVGQALGIYTDIAAVHSLDLLVNLVFYSSGIPIAMLLFLGANREGARFERLHLLDFLQVCVFWLCVYLFFSGEAVTASATVGATRFGWSTSLVFDGVLSFSFALRALLSNSRATKNIFVLMALYLFGAGMADSYAGFGPNLVEPGTWFDLVWSLLLLLPFLIGVMVKEPEPAVSSAATRTQRIVVDQFFPLLYPFCSLLLIMQIAERQRFQSSCIAAAVFVTVAVRVLAIQHQLIKAQEALRFDATHDALTGLFNRGEILDRLERELDRQRRTGEPVGVIMVDTDHFKTINDTHGHLVGDEVLREVSHRLKASARVYDSVGRYGGEEFLIVAPGCDVEGTLACALRFREDVENPPFATSVGAIPVTVSAGAITTTGITQGLDCSMVLRMADEALYRAKAKGRNRVESASLWGKGAKESKEPIPAPGAELQHNL